MRRLFFILLLIFTFCLTNLELNLKDETKSETWSRSQRVRFFQDPQKPVYLYFWSVWAQFGLQNQNRTAFTFWFPLILLSRVGFSGRLRIISRVSVGLTCFCSGPPEPPASAEEKNSSSAGERDPKQPKQIKTGNAESAFTEIKTRS